MARKDKRQPILFAQLGKTRGRGALLGQAIAVGRLAKQWDKIVGDSLAAKTCPYKVYGKTLTVNVTDSPLLQELSFFKDDLLLKINEQLPDSRIETIQFKIGMVL